MCYSIDICSICLSQYNNPILFTSQDTDGSSFEDKLKYFLPGLELNSNIPKYICAKCQHDLSRMYEFKQKCLQNITTYEKYARKETTKDGYKYFILMRPDFSERGVTISNEDDYDSNILESQGEMNVGIVNNEELIIKEEASEELILDDKLELILHKIKEENFQLDTSEQSEYIIEKNGQISDNSVSYLTEVGMEQYECYVCCIKFVTILELNNHMLSHSTVPNKCQNENIEKTAQVSNDTVLPLIENENIGEQTDKKYKFHDRKLYECKLCNKSFTYHNSFKKHQEYHENEGLACKICKKSFEQINYLKRHYSIHSSEKPYKCETCNKSFRHSYSLKLHKLLHTDVKSYTCEVCNKSFRHLSTLRCHKLLHNGEKPYTCEFCDKSFKKLSSLKQHKLIHTGEKPHTCEVCNKSFRLPQHLKSHKYLHTNQTPFTCEICNKSFTSKQSLQKHLRDHPNFKFKCGDCDKKFPQKSSLKRHSLDLHEKTPTLKNYRRKNYISVI